MELVTVNGPLSNELIDQVLFMDKKAYPREFGSVYPSVRERAQKTRDGFILLFDKAPEKARLVGYIWFFPISCKLASLIKEGHYLNDCELNQRFIFDWNESPKTVYISSIVISVEYRGTKAIKLLMMEFDDLIKAKAEKHGIEETLAIAVSSKGRDCLFKSGYETIYSALNGTKVVRKKFKDPSKSIV